jgi:peroxiredoxin
MPGQVGDKAPDFKLPSPDHGEVTLGQYAGEKHVILSFHVFDFTAG